MAGPFFQLQPCRVAVGQVDPDLWRGEGPQQAQMCGPTSGPLCAVNKSPTNYTLRGSNGVTGTRALITQALLPSGVKFSFIVIRDRSQQSVVRP